VKEFFKKIWQGWKKIAHKIGRFQTLVILTIVYFLIISPLGLVGRLFGWDPLDSRGYKRHKTTSFQQVRDSEPDLESLKRHS
jgi:hypothetical protein